MIELFVTTLAAQCSYVDVPAASEKAMRYYNSGNVLWLMQTAWSFLLPLLFLITGFSGKLGKFAEKWGKNWYFSIVIYLILFLSIFTLASIPLDYYGEFMRQHEYGLSTQTLGRWINSFWKQFLVGLVGSVAFIWIFYLLLKKSPKKWWLYSSFTAIAISFFLMVVQPIWVDPLFNKFGPMKNKELEQDILSLAKRAGISQGRVFEVDKSQDTKMLNAYVIGLGSTNRIVLWDTTIKRLTTDEILFVMGHEMGHYVLHHLWWGMLFMSISAFVLFYFLYRSSAYFLKKYHKRFGFKNLYNIASLPLLLLLLNVFSFLSAPISNYISRQMERNADRFGLEITQDNEAAARAFIALQQENLANPRPGAMYMLWRGTHPSLGERIDFCNSYCPWREGYQLKYGKFFKPENN